MEWEHSQPVELTDDVRKRINCQLDKGQQYQFMANEWAQGLKARIELSENVVSQSRKWLANLEKLFSKMEKNELEI